eukprot:1787318-Alexandrium_andersonii.AAC.1
MMWPALLRFSAMSCSDTPWLSRLPRAPADAVAARASSLTPGAARAPRPLSRGQAAGGRPSTRAPSSLPRRR